MRIATIKVIFISLLFWVSPSFGLDTSAQEKTCSEIGFKKKTEAFGNCVLELVNRGGDASSKPSQASFSNDSDDAACRGYGFKPNSGDYASCRQRIDLAKQSAKQQQDIYDQQKRQYDDQLASIEKQKAKERNMKQLEMGLRMMGGQSVQDSAMATARMPPLPQAPGPITQRITMPNGRSMTCTTMGTNTNCF
jgi:hypothetical protein